MADSTSVVKLYKEKHYHPEPPKEVKTDIADLTDKGFPHGVKSLKVGMYAGDWMVYTDINHPEGQGKRVSEGGEYPSLEKMGFSSCDAKSIKSIKQAGDS